MPVKVVSIMYLEILCEAFLLLSINLVNIKLVKLYFRSLELNKTFVLFNLFIL